MKKQKAQAWSLDIMLATIIFVGTIFFFFLVLNNTQDTKTEELKKDAEKITNSVFSENGALSIIDGGDVNESKLENLLEQNYTDLKKQVGIENDFCLYLEDETGNIISINSSFTGVGSGDINVSDIPCG
ncbi:hypothetical protein ISS07_03795 [Candidatus Woesearchaeota archaeon]|nr:hypothetical protein [Candidatus Woesearchaeota archaeon]